MPESMPINKIYLFIAIAQSFRTTNGILCYSCSNVGFPSKTPDCTSHHEAVLEQYIVDCGQMGLNFQGCSTVYRKGGYVVIRDCMRQPIDPTSAMGCKWQHGLAVCFCDKDFCNGQAPEDGPVDTAEVDMNNEIQDHKEHKHEVDKENHSGEGSGYFSNNLQDDSE